MCAYHTNNTRTDRQTDSHTCHLSQARPTSLSLSLSLSLSHTHTHTHTHTGMNNMSSAPIFPVIVIVCIAFGVACAFLDVWDMVIDTIFQCYCMDEEYGTGELLTCC
jgi:hypothetical protein